MNSSSSAPGFFLPLASLCQREIVRFLRQRSRVVGALGTPLIFWFLLGSGFGSSFRPASGALETGYLEYFFPGTVLMIVLFTSIFSNISVIEERREGFLLSVLVAPASRLSLVLGKILGVTTLAVLQGGLLLLLSPLLGIRIGWDPMAAIVGRGCAHRGGTGGPWICLCVETGFDSGISRSDEPPAGSHVAAVWCAVSDVGCFVVGSRDHADQSHDLCDECPAASSVPRRNEPNPGQSVR